jgi:hypothetical protein
MAAQTSTATNIQSPDLSGAKTDAAKFYTNLYSVDFATSPEINDAYVAFFEEYSGNSYAGNQMAATVLYSAKAQGLDPMQVLQDFAALTRRQIDVYLAAFLNLNRVQTSVLGIKNPISVNQYVSRSILP